MWFCSDMSLFMFVMIVCLLFGLLSAGQVLFCFKIILYFNIYYVFVEKYMPICTYSYAHT